MPPRNPELPEGTDHIINGAMSTDTAPAGGTGAGTGGGDFGGAPGGDGGAFIGGAGGGGNSGDGTGGTTLAGSTSIGASGEDLTSGAPSGGGVGGDMASGGSGGAPIKQQLRDGVDSARQQAGDKIRTYALQGKDRATSALDDFSQVVNDAAEQIEERLGAQYGDYARRAAGTVSEFAETLRNKEVDELFDDAREIVRKSPGVAIGAAAVVGFTLVRLIKAGLDNDVGNGRGSGGSGGTVEFEPEGGRNIDFQPAGGSGSTGTGQGA